MLSAAAPTRVAGPLVYGDFGDGEGWYQEITEITWDPISGLGSPFKFKKVFKKVFKAVKKVVKPVAHVVGGVLRIAAPVMGLIPGIGVPLAMGATLAGKMMQRDKPLQVFKQKATLFQVGGAGLAAFGVGKLASGLGFGALAKAVPTSEILRGTSGYDQIPAGAMETASMGDVLGSVGRLAATGLQVYSRMGGQEPAAAPPEPMYQTPYGPEPIYPGQPYLASQPPGNPFLSDFPGITAGGPPVTAPEGGILEAGMGGGLLGIPPIVLLGGGALLLLALSGGGRR